jgi:hypothetical protein
MSKDAKNSLILVGLAIVVSGAFYLGAYVLHDVKLPRWAVFTGLLTMPLTLLTQVIKRHLLRRGRAPGRRI